MPTKKQPVVAEQLPPEQLDNPIIPEPSDSDDMHARKVLLKLKHVDVKFNVRGRTLNAIRDANLEIFEGETLAIVGESGSGKSVLTKTFAGMLDANGFISHGNIYFSDDSLSQTQVLLNWKNRMVRRSIINKLNGLSYEEGAAAEYKEWKDLIEKERKAAILSPEKTEQFETDSKRINDDLIDANNALMALNRRNPEENQRRIELKRKVKALKKEQAALNDQFKFDHKQTKAAFKSDVAAREAFRSKKAELEAKRAQIIADAKAKGLDPRVVRRNEIIAEEVTLSLGRYPLYLQIKYTNQLMKGYAEAMRMGRDLFTAKQNRRVFEPVVFRVEYKNHSVVETNRLKAWIEESFAKSIAKDVMDDEILSNDSLIEQAYGLHPYLKKSVNRRIAKIIASSNFAASDKDKASKIADLILLKVSDFNSTIHAWIWANKLVSYVKGVYAGQQKDYTCKFKAKPLDSLNGYAHIDCAKVRYFKDWEKIRGCRIATVFQDPMTSLDPIIPIGKQIMIVIQKHQHCSIFEAKRRALSIMEKVGIPDPEKRFDDYPFQYSGGMRQRIVIAIALSCQPKILICDEPTTALDVTIQAQIIRLIKKLSKDLGFTTVYITHDLGVVANVAERVAVLYGGQIIELGTVEDIFYDPRHPYTWALLSSLPQLATSGEELSSINGTPPSLYNKIIGDAFAPRNEYAMAIDFVKEPPMFDVNEHHSAKTWLLDPRAPKVEKPKIIQNLHEKMVKIYEKEEK